MKGEFGKDECAQRDELIRLKKLPQGFNCPNIDKCTGSVCTLPQTERPAVSIGVTVFEDPNLYDQAQSS